MVTRAAWHRWLNNPRNGALYSAGVVAAILGLVFLPDIVDPLLGPHHWSHTIMWFGLYVAAIIVLLLIFRHLGFAPHVYAELRARGHDVCRKCGYRLDGLPENHERCPECGARRPGPHGRAATPPACIPRCR